METNVQEKRQEEKVLKPVQIIIPQCCREGWATCIHVPKRFRKGKGNVGL